MAEYVAIPKLGMAMTEATLVQWKVAEGGRVERGDVILTIETEKTNWDIEAAASGFLHILVEADVTAPVGRVVGLIAATEEELSTLQAEPPRELFTTAPEVTEAPRAAAAPGAASPAARGGAPVSPLARKLAAEHGLDLSQVTGSGPGGRIVREDVERALAERTAAGAAPAIHEGKRVKAIVPLKGMRKTIAEHMHRSLSVAAQLTYLGEIEMTEAVKLRDRLREQEAATGARITYTDIVVVAIARALRENPIMNSSIVENEIRVWEDINIGVAVALDHGLEGGLIVPVLRNADQMSITEVSLALQSLIERARANKLLPDDVSGGTFTLTNLGTAGGGWFFGTPIINQPQSAILGLGSISDRPVARAGDVVIRPMMPYSLTFDHRVIDGAPAMKFAIRLTELLEQPELLFT